MKLLSPLLLLLAIVLPVAVAQFKSFEFVARTYHAAGYVDAATPPTGTDGGSRKPDL